MAIPVPLAFPPTSLRNISAGGVVGNEIGSSSTRGKVLSSAQLKAIVEASGISYLPLSGGTLTGALTGTSITLAQGSLQSGGLSFGGAGGANIYGRSQAFVFGTANVKALEIAWDYTRVARESWIGWSDGNFDATNNNVRVSLYSDAAGKINQRNGLNAQCYVISKSYTSGSSQEALMLDAGKQISGKLGIYSYRGTSGGSNYPIQIGPLAADGTTFGDEYGAMSVETNGQVKIGTGSGTGKSLNVGDYGVASTGGYTSSKHSNTIAYTNAAFNITDWAWLQHVTTGNSLVIATYTSGEAMRFLQNGGITIANVPTSDPHVLNQIWKDGDTLKLSAG